MTTVIVKNCPMEKLKWPLYQRLVLIPGMSEKGWRCACCNGLTDGVILIRHNHHEEHVVNSFPMLVPSCADCRKHQETATGASDWYPSGCWLGVIAIVLLASGYGAFDGSNVRLTGLIVLFIIVLWIIAYTFIASRWIKSNRQYARPEMKPECTGAIFVHYKRTPPELLAREFTDTLAFSNDSYADAFCEFNDGKKKYHGKVELTPLIPNSWLTGESDGYD